MLTASRSFTTHKLHIFNKMLMAHLTSSSQLVNMIDRLLANIPLNQLCYCLDDLCLASDCVKIHLDRLEMVLDKLLASNMKLMPTKCEFLKHEVKFVGHTISQEGMKINEDRAKAMRELPPPRTRKEAQHVMGNLSYNLRFETTYIIDKQKRAYWEIRYG